MEKIMEKVRKYATADIYATVLKINKPVMTEDERMVRAALIEVYAERSGVEAADKLMDRLGM